MLALLLRTHIGEILGKGLESIGTSLAQAFRVELANPLLKQAESVGDGIKGYFFSQSVPGVKQEDIDISAVLKVELTKVDTLARQGQLDRAFESLAVLRKKYPKELEVLRKIIELSERGDAKGIRRRTALQIVQSAEPEFPNDPDYFTLLAMCYVGAREDEPRAKMYKQALVAAEKAIELETNADKVARRLSVVGMVHFYFSAVEQAIQIAEQALTKLKGVTSKTGMDSIARVKNNLSFFMAERSNLSDKPEALEMAQSVVEYDEKNQADEYLPASWDTLGYVLFRFADNREEIEKALTYFEKALAIAPDDIDYQKHKIIAQTALAT